MEPQNDNQPQKVFTPDNSDENQEDYRARGLTSTPYSTPQPVEPLQPKAQNGVINDPLEKSGFKIPKRPLIAGIVGAVLVIILIIVALIAGGGGDKTGQDKPSTDNSALTPALQPAQSVELEQTNNALSQDLSGLDDEKDLPNNSLEDQTLGL